MPHNLREDVELIEGVYGDFDAEPLSAGKNSTGIFWKCHQ